MPFNGSNRIEALFAFVDQYVAGDAAMRSGFDQIVGDVVASVNAAITYLEGLTATGTDQRYLGTLVTVPTARLDASALQAGDFYISGHADAGRVGLAYVYDGAAFDVVSDFSTIGAFFKDALSSAATPAAARTALELGTMAIQNTSSFAPASVATDVALAIKLLTDGIAKSVPSNDWDNAHLAGPGTSMVAANSAALNAPVSANTSGIYIAYDANNGFVLAVSHSDGVIYRRTRAATVWGTWQSLANAQSLSSLALVAGDIFYATGPGAVARLAKATTALQVLRWNAALSAMEWATPPFSAAFVSSQQTLTSGALLTLAHGLGVVPKLITGYLVCQTIDAGYAVNDQVEVSLVVNSTAGNTRANGVYFDATNVYVRLFNGGGIFTISNKTTGNATSITDANWKLVVRAYA